MYRVNRLLMLLGLLCIAGIATALSTDQQQPIQIEADRLDIDEQAQVSRYQGNVSVVQGSLRVEADQVVLHFDSDNNLRRMEISGQPAHLQQQTDDGEDMVGKALEMTYFEQESRLELRQQASLRNGKDVIESDLITVNTKTNALQAGSDERKQRVRMLIQPRAE